MKLWRWNIDSDGIAWSRAAGLNIVPMGLNEAGPEYEAGKIDGFIALPTSALAFQWSARVHHLLDLPHGYLAGCLVITKKSWDRLNVSQQQIVRADAVKAIARVDEVSRLMDEKLLGGLLQKQGISVAEPTAAMRKELLEATRAARALPDAKVAPAVLRKVEAMLTELRASRPH